MNVLEHCTPLRRAAGVELESFHRHVGAQDGAHDRDGIPVHGLVSSEPFAPLDGESSLGQVNELDLMRGAIRAH